MRERGTGRLFLRGEIWWCQYYLRGAQIRVSTGEIDERKAGKFLRLKLAEVQTDTHTDAHRLTYEQMREAYYQDYTVNGRKSLRRDKDGNPTLDKVVRLDDFFAGFLASEIDTDLLRKFIAHEQEREMSNGSINRSLSALRRMFHLAKEDGKLRHLPHFPMLEEATPRRGFVELAQYEKLSRELPNYLRAPLALGFFTAMRLGEVLSVTWAQVDFLANTITLHAGETKNGAGRVIPICAPLRSLLHAQRAQRQPACPFVCFKLDKRGMAVKLESFRKAWASAAKRAGLPGLLFHDLRRSGVRNLVRSGVPERTAMAISGHLTRAVFDRYNIVNGNDLADAGRKLETFFGENGDKTGTECTEMQQPDSPVH